MHPSLLPFYDRDAIGEATGPGRRVCDPRREGR
jgi:hypothetical protein